MRRPDVGSSKAAPVRVVPRFGQTGHDKSESGSKETWDVLHDDDSRSKNANGAGELEPQSRASAVSESSAEASVGDVLAREATTEHVDGLNLSPVNGGDVSVVGDAGPVTREDLVARLLTRLGIELPNAGEQIAVGWQVTPPPL